MGIWGVITGKGQTLKSKNLDPHTVPHKRSKRSRPRYENIHTTKTVKELKEEGNIELT